MMVYRFSMDKLPDKSVERTELILNLRKLTSVVYSRRNLRSIPNHIRVTNKALHVFVGVLGYFSWVEIIEGFPQGFSPPEYKLPSQTRLKTFQNEKLKQRSVIMDGNAPLLIMVLDIKGIVRIPASYELFTHEIQWPT
jgi:hypothetical protein